jgi:hypothetical protein
LFSFFEISSSDTPDKVAMSVPEKSSRARNPPFSTRFAENNDLQQVMQEIYKIAQKLSCDKQSQDTRGVLDMGSSYPISSGCIHEMPKI